MKKGIIYNINFYNISLAICLIKYNQSNQLYSLKFVLLLTIFPNSCVAIEVIIEIIEVIDMSNDSVQVTVLELPFNHVPSIFSDCSSKSVCLLGELVHHSMVVPLTCIWNSELFFDNLI